MSSVIVFDLETVPDLDAAARMLAMVGESAEAVRAALGDKFPKLALHKIVCIGALIAERQDDHWTVRSVGAPSIAERTEAELIKRFVDKVEELRPRLVGYNLNGFDLPVLRYRAMVHRVAAPGLEVRPYFRRYADDALDLCDVLGSFDSRAKMPLHELCRVLDLPGKPDGVDGSGVEDLIAAGRIADVAAYCETDVVNTYRVWLIHELFCGRLGDAGYAASEAALLQHVRAKAGAKPYLESMIH
ncbi:MAG: hypothetical protein K1X67_12340 [Fimbriimonadaceae bacterium]|nr:hypothetical protein [Fimbriimonadaceae bacterium]